MSNAAKALIEVVLTHGDGEDPAGIYGRTYSEKSPFDKEIELFRRSENDNVTVCPNHYIFPMRSALAVLVDGNLKIIEDLKDHDTVSFDDEIAKGTAEFKPDILKWASRFIEGRHGMVEMRVKWR